MEHRQLKNSDRACEGEALRTLMETIPHISWHLDKNGEFKFVSAQFLKYTGLKLTKEIDRHLWDQVIHPDDLKITDREIQKAGKDHNPLIFQHRMKVTSGQYRWNMSHGNPVFNKTNDFIGWMGTTTDIHQQKIAEQELKQNEAKFKQIVNAVPHILWTAKPDGLIDWENEKFHEYTGLRTSTKFDSNESPLHPDDIVPTAKRWSHSISSGEVFEIEHRIKRKSDGKYYWHLAKGVPVKNDHGKIVHWVGSSTNVHDRKIFSDALERSEQEFRLLANALPQIIWTSTPEFEVDWYNDWWYSYLQSPRGTKWDDPEKLPMHPEDVARTKLKIEESIRTGDDFLMEQRFRRGSDGLYRWHLVRAVPIKDEEGTITKWIGANTDIHDHKILVNKLQEEKELRERVVAALSHDLRTPLTSAKLTAQVMRRSYVQNEKITRSTDRIVSNLDRVDRMIQDILDASRLSAGESLPLVLQDCDLTSEIHLTVEELRHLHGNRFEIIEDHSDLQGKWDCGGIRRILENLCNNAVKYGDHELPITIRIGRSSNDEVTLSVQNHGTPIPSDEIKQLFEPYTRSPGAQSSKKKGWGIGLMLVKGVVDAHGGTVAVSSAKDKGTTFTIRFPGI
jgi:PAS domain S-box-containing protein